MRKEPEYYQMKKIVHICLCGPVTDGWSYQDNLLPKYHKLLGYEVSIITSEWIWGEDGKLKKDSRSSYRNEYEIPVIRLPIKRGKSIEAKFKRYAGIYEAVKRENADILFIHGCQFMDIWKIIQYVKKHSKVRVFIDNHADFSNSGTNFLSKYVLHKGIWKAGAKAIEPYVERFYGVLPARVDFLRDMYHISKEKIELLVMGADDEKVQLAKTEKWGKLIRDRFDISQEDFLIVTGGKIDSAKYQTLYLMQAVKNIPDEKVKLIVFGSVEEELRKQVENLVDGKRVQFVGWISAEESYSYFEAADLVCFPGRHSVFWEQAAGQGIPMVVKYWTGTNHVDLGGNVKFLYEDSTDEIQEILAKVADHKKEIYIQMKKVAEEEGKKKFSYCAIAKRAIEERIVQGAGRE